MLSFTCLCNWIKFSVSIVKRLYFKNWFKIYNYAIEKVELFISVVGVSVLSTIISCYKSLFRT
jgi:hypothetical protein